jgi:sorbitol/mannitol transport system substrate-binding protein
VPLSFGPSYDVDDLLPPIRSALSYDGKLFAAPFYGESSMIMYRKDLFAKAGLTMPERPQWDFIKAAADKITDKQNGVYGICLRGKAGWGENIAFLTTMANSFGARWFNEKWQPEFTGPQWKTALDTYLDMMKKDGPPGASSNGFNENLALFQSGKCGMWIDATVAASFVSDPKQSKVANDVGFAPAPCGTTCKNANWLWAWALAIPSSSKKKEAAAKFIAWATGKEYIGLVAEKYGWANVPPGTRKSLYANPAYLKAAPFAEMTLKAIDSADPGLDGNSQPKPYIGVQYAAIPEFQGVATAVGQQFSAALAGQSSAGQALQAAQLVTEREMRRAGYAK